VNTDPNIGFFLEHQHNSFDIPSNLYNTGIDADKLSSLFLNSYNTSSKNLGVMLTGVKGTGKSLLLKLVSNKALNQGLPIILVSESFNSSKLVQFLSSISIDCVVLFDEFEKYYLDKDDTDSNQNDLLTFFDGTSQSHKLIVLTANRIQNVSEYFINRPSRVKYLVRYKGLPEKFVLEYLQKNLEDPSLTPLLLDELTIIKEMNFDLLKTVVDEVNTLSPSMTVGEIVSILNITDSTENYDSYIATSYLNGKEIAVDLFPSLDFNDLNYGEEFVPLDSLRAYFKTQDKSIKDCFLNRNNTVSVKGRNHLKTTLDTELGAVTIDIQRVKYTGGAF
jgi:hypothetical protein